MKKPRFSESQIVAVFVERGKPKPDAQIEQFNRTVLHRAQRCAGLYLAGVSELAADWPSRNDTERPQHMLIRVPPIRFLHRITASLEFPSVLSTTDRGACPTSHTERRVRTVGDATVASKRWLVLMAVLR